MASIRVYPAVFLFGQAVLAASVVAATPMSRRTGAPVPRIPVTLHAGRDLSQFFNGKIHILGPGPVRPSFAVTVADDLAWRAPASPGVLHLAAKRSLPRSMAA